MHRSSTGRNPFRGWAIGSRLSIAAVLAVLAVPACNDPQDYWFGTPGETASTSTTPASDTNGNSTNPTTPAKEDLVLYGVEEHPTDQKSISLYVIDLPGLTYSNKTRVTLNDATYIPSSLARRRSDNLLFLWTNPGGDLFRIDPCAKDAIQRITRSGADQGIVHGMAFDKDETLWGVGVLVAQPTEGLCRIDPATGAATYAMAYDRNVNGLSFTITAMGADPSGVLHAVGGQDPAMIVKVDTSTGKLSLETVMQSPPAWTFHSIAYDGKGALYVAVVDDQGYYSIVDVNPTNGDPGTFIKTPTNITFGVVTFAPPCL